MGVKQIFKEFSYLNVLIIGDVMIDEYISGSVDRISPEGPVPVLHVKTTEERLGGAANVALNIKALGATPILCSVTGKDGNGKKFLSLLKKNKIASQYIIQSSERITTTKTRLLSHNQQIARVDSEMTDLLSDKDREVFLKTVLLALSKEKINVVIFEDYDKGVLDRIAIEKIISVCNAKKIPVAVDPKKNNFFNYKKADLFKPNLREMREALNLPIDSISSNSLKSVSDKLRRIIHNGITMITLSEYGVFIEDDATQFILPAHRRNVADVSGAGDTVISVAALTLALGLSVEIIAELSNLAGGLVCEQPGVVPVNKEHLLNEALKYVENKNY
jgi:D-glycero-beta-D-manno-heptose-7-phosphate kinase